MAGQFNSYKLEYTGQKKEDSPLHKGQEQQIMDLEDHSDAYIYTRMWLSMGLLTPVPMYVLSRYIPVVRTHYSASENQKLGLPLSVTYVLYIHDRAGKYCIRHVICTWNYGVLLYSPKIDRLV